MNVADNDKTSSETTTLRAMGAQIRHMAREELALKAGYELTADDIDSLEKGENNMLTVPFFEVCPALGVTLNDLTVEYYADKLMPEEFSRWDEKEREAALMTAAFYAVRRK